MFKRCALVLPVLVCLVAGALPARAEMEISPPDHARIVGSIPQLTFRWGGRPDRLYQVEVVSVRGALVATQTTRQSWVTITLPATNVEYRWRLRELVGREFRDVASRSFHLSTDPACTFDGQEGAEGANGASGPSLTVNLKKAGDYIRFQVGGGPATIDFLLIPSSTPVAIRARGGKGGPGKRGLDGYSAVTGPIDGGAGGPGGNGGKGGTVRVITNGVDARKHVTINVDGGDAGKGGRGGEPGTTPYRAQPGADGVDGKPGDPGEIVFE